jgi:hypothetical protein
MSHNLNATLDARVQATTKLPGRVPPLEVGAVFSLEPIRTLPPAPFADTSLRSVPITSPLRNGLMAAGLTLTASLAVATAAHAEGDPRPPQIQALEALRPNQTLRLAPGVPLDPAALRGDHTRPYQTTKTPDGLTVQRLANAAALAPPALDPVEKLFVAVGGTLTLLALGVMAPLVWKK